MVEKVDEIFNVDSHWLKLHLKNPDTGERIVSNVRADGMMLGQKHNLYHPGDLESIPSQGWVGQEIEILLPGRKRS